MPASFLNMGQLVFCMKIVYDHPITHIQEVFP